MYTEAQKRANEKYKAKAYTKMTLQFKKSDYEIFNKWIMDNKLSKNGYIIELIKKNCPAFYSEN